MMSDGSSISRKMRKTVSDLTRLTLACRKASSHEHDHGELRRNAASPHLTHVEAMLFPHRLTNDAAP